MDEEFINSIDGKREILTKSSILALIQILIDKKIVTPNEFDKYQERYEEEIIDVIKKTFKEKQ